MGKRVNQGGFQLIELVLVCSIIGIVLAAAVPNFASRNAIYRAEGANRELSSRLQIARQRAIATRTPFRFILDRSARTYHFERQETDSSWADDPAMTYSIDGVDGIQATIGGSVTREEIQFLPRGTVADDDSPAEILIFSTKGDTSSLSLVRTGRITLTLHPAPSS